MAKVCRWDEVQAEAYHEGAKGVQIRWLIEERKDGAPNYNLRLIEVDEGGHTPHHTHRFEHENYVLGGEGEVQIGAEVHRVREGDVIYIPEDVEHQYRNVGAGPFRFLCGIPTPWVQVERRKRLEKERA